MRKRIAKYAAVAVIIYLMQAYAFASLDIGDFTELARIWGMVVVACVIIGNEFTHFAKNL